MKKLLAILVVSILVLTGCGNSSAGKTVIGVSMPTKDHQRWIQDGDYLKKEFEAKGYKVLLQYSQDDEAKQAEVIENMIAQNADVLIVAATNGSALGSPLQTAADNDIPVVAYDRLLTNTPNVTSYVTFDNELVGHMQGKYIIDQLGLDLNDKSESYNLEIFSGSEGDSNSGYFYSGAMAELQPYIDAGILKVLSGQTTLAQTATPVWASDKAQERMDNILTAYYSGGKKVDAILASADCLSEGIIPSLISAGYTDADWPIVTGQDCDVASIKYIKDKKQSMSIFKDTSALAAKTVDVTEAILAGEEPEYNNTTTYDNGEFVVPAILLDPVLVTEANIQEVLIDSGYYTQEEIDAGKVEE
ncbi:MAG: substrate-binding domain-containing protein [Mycoplasmatales bacterium]